MVLLEAIERGIADGGGIALVAPAVLLPMLLKEDEMLPARIVVAIREKAIRAVAKKKKKAKK